MVSAGLSDSISLPDISMTSGPASRSNPVRTIAGRLPDKAFDSNGLRHRLAESGAMVCIPPKSARRIAYRFDRRLYAHRHTIENYFARIKRHRRIATRYEKQAVTFLGLVQFATVLDWLTHEV
jgi:transposase